MGWERLRLLPSSSHKFVFLVCCVLAASKKLARAQPFPHYTEAFAGRRSVKYMYYVFGRELGGGGV